MVLFFFALQSISLEEDVVLCGHSECHVTTRTMLAGDSARATSLLQGVHLSLKANIMAYGSTPYVGMTPKKNGSHIESYK